MATFVDNPGLRAMESIKEAHTLVTELYHPSNQRNPARVNEIQARLQQLQKNEHGWMIADALLREPSTHHRFIGALTFTVKINVSKKEIKEEIAFEALQHLVNHFVALVNQGEQAMVIRKLASSLVALFMQPVTPWKHALLQLAASLAHGGYVSENECQSTDFQNTVIPALSQKQVVALLFFSNALAEEAMRLGGDTNDLDAAPQGDPDVMRDRKGMSVTVRVTHNTRDAFLLVQYVLRQIIQHVSVPDHGALEPALGAEAINSWKTWRSVHGNYSSSYKEGEGQEVLDLARLCARDIIESLRVPSLAEHAASILTTAIENRRAEFDDEARARLSQILIDSLRARHIPEGDEDSDKMTFIDLMVAFVLQMHFHLFEEFTDQPNKELLSILHDIFKAPGYPAIEDLATPRVLEYWNEIAECLADEIEPDDPRYQVVKGHLATVVLALFNKLLYPTPEDLQGWTDEERSGFNAFRHEACDYLLSVYPVLGVELVRVFQESATSYLNDQNWRSFEAAMFCIAQLSEAVDENGHADQCLDAIFGSDTFARVCVNGEVQIPLKSRQTLVDAFGRYESYFQRHNSVLPGVLNILFESLNFESCAQTASKSILTLSKSCSRALTTALPAFLEQLDQFRTKPTATVSTMPKVLEGIATIIGTLPTDEEKAQTVERILQSFVHEAHTAREEATASAYDSARTRGHIVLSCIASIGKGLRAESEDVINIEAAPVGNPYPPSFWNSGGGAGAQRLIMEAMRLLVVDFPVDVSIIEAACDILKAGYTESSGLFVFPPSITVDFIKSFPLGVSGTDTIMATASSFLASHGPHAMQIRDEAVALIVHVAELFFSMLENPNVYDPETANAGIDFLARLLPKYYPILFSLTDSLPGPASDPGSQRPPVLAILLNFTLHALMRPEPLPLRSASAFWVALLDMRTSSAEHGMVIQQVFEQFVPSLCHTVIQQIAGRCARSDLVSLNDVLRRTIFKQMPLARPSLTAALNSLDTAGAVANGQPALHLSPTDKSRFLESLIVARGARQQSLDLVRSFWLKCRGMSYDYAH